MGKSIPYNYEDAMMQINEVFDLIDEALIKRKPLSLGRYGHGELAYLGWTHFPHWARLLEPHCAYAGATAPIATIEGDLNSALRATDIVGFHVSVGEAWEDRKTAKLTAELLEIINYRPNQVCSALITHEMIKNDRFWSMLKKNKVALIGRRAGEARLLFENKGINVTVISTLEGYEEIEKVYQLLAGEEKDWDIALLSAGIPATILAPRLANQTKKVVIDFGHALDRAIEGEKYNYRTVWKNWQANHEEKIMVSVVMAVCNGERFLKESVGSVLKQTYANLELIVVNDGSIDKTKEILDNIEDKRLKVIHLEENKGAAAALNTGISRARGTWIAIQDADDISYRTKIAEQVKYVRTHPHLVGVGTLVEYIPGDSSISKSFIKWLTKNRNAVIKRRQIRKTRYYISPLTHSTVMFAKAVFWEVGGYNPEFKILYDYDLWLRLLEKGEMEKVPKTLLKYRVLGSSLSRQNRINTTNEIQAASSKAICRLLGGNSQYQPRIVVIGTQKACERYFRYTAPFSGLIVHALLYEDIDKQVNRAIKSIKAKKADAIILLGCDKGEKLMRRFERHGLELNKQIFNIYSN